MVEHVAKAGEPKIVARCTYPLTAMHCVDRIYTDLAVIDVTDRGLKVVEMVDGMQLDELQRLTGAQLALKRKQRANYKTIGSRIPPRSQTITSRRTHHPRITITRSRW